MQTNVARTLLIALSIVAGQFGLPQTAQAADVSGHVDVTYTKTNSTTMQVRIDGRTSYSAAPGSQLVWTTCWEYGGYYTGWYSYSCQKRQTINYYIYPRVDIQSSATNLKATVNGSSVGIQRGSKYTVSNISTQSVDLIRRISSGQSANWTLEYEVQDSGLRSKNAVRISDPYTSLCAWGGTLDSGSVTFRIPTTFAEVSTSPEMSETTEGSYRVYSSGRINQPRKKPHCIEAVNEAAFTLTSHITARGSKISVLSYPEDSLWRTQVNDSIVAVANALEDITGITLSQAGDVRVREAAAQTELFGSYAGTYDSGLARVSEEFDLETLAHELAHHWYGDGIADNWAFEGLAEYLGKEALSQIGEKIEEKPCSEGWFYSQREAKAAVQLSSWEFADLYGTKDERAAQLSRIGILYGNACALFSWTMDDIPNNARKALFKALATADLADTPAGQSQISSREVIDLLIMADSLDGSPDDIQRAIDEKLGLLTQEEVAGLGARRDALESYAPAYLSLAAAGWQAPELIASALKSGDYATLGTYAQEVDAAAVAVGFTSWADLVDAAFQRVSAVTTETSAIGLALAGVATLDEAVRFTSDLEKVSTSLASLGENTGSNDPLSLIGRLILGDVEVHTADAISAIDAGDLDGARSFTGSATFSRDSAWVAGSGALLLVALLGLWLAYQTRAGKKRIKPVLMKVKTRLRR